MEAFTREDLVPSKGRIARRGEEGEGKVRESVQYRQQHCLTDS